MKIVKYWKIRCSQSSCGTAAVWYPCTPRGRVVEDVGIHGGPTLPVDPGYGAVVRVEFEIVKPGKSYPPNPYPRGSARGVDRRPSKLVQKHFRKTKKRRGG